MRIGKKPLPASHNKRVTRCAECSRFLTPGEVKYKQPKVLALLARGASGFRLLFMEFLPGSYRTGSQRLVT